MEIQNYTKYERARMIGSRALQLSMGAPFLIKLSKKDLQEIKYNPIKIAAKEFDEGVLPISIKRPFPNTMKKVKEEPEPAEE